MFCMRFFKTFLQQNNIFIIYENEFFAFYCYKAILQYFSQRFHFKNFYKKISPQITLKRNLMLFISYDWFPNVEYKW